MSHSRKKKYATKEEARQANIRKTRERVERLVALGYCRACTKRKARDGITVCEECLAKLVAKKNVLNKKRREAGLCHSCGKPSYRNGSCVLHLVKERQDLRKRKGHIPFVEKGIGSPPLPGTENEEAILNGYTPGYIDR